METQKERWAKVYNIDGEYMISDLGNMVNVKTGKRVGHIGQDKYVHFFGRINGKVKNFKVHQLVYNAFGGDSYDGRKIVIDHINNVRSDNRINNLQLLKFRDNCNKDIVVGRSGVMGVSWNTAKQRWLAQISLGGRRYVIGFRKTITEAKNLYDEALYLYEAKGLTPIDLKEKLPEGKKRCTLCKKVLDIIEFNEIRTCNGHIGLNPKCKSCYKEYRRINDAKYRSKIVQEGPVVYEFK